MPINRIALDRYPDARRSFHIHKVSGDCEAQKLHVHDYFQIYYILQGHIIHVLDDTRAGLTRGDVFIIPPERSHRIEMGDRRAAFYSFSFKADFFDHSGFWAAYPGRFLIGLQAAGSDVRPRITIPPDRQVSLEMMMETIMDEFAARSPGGDSVIQGLLTAVLTLLARVYFGESGVESGETFENYRQSMLYCIEYIRANAAQDITLTGMTRLGAMSRSNFCLLFRHFTGMSFGQYLNKQRIDRAIDLIRHSRHDLAQVAALCGYGEYSTFYRNFVRFAGIAPADLKRATDPGIGQRD